METSPNYEPTPEEIAESCRQIRETWTDKERQRRIRCDWRIPEPNTESIPVRKFVRSRKTVEEEPQGK